MRHLLSCSLLFVTVTIPLSGLAQESILRQLTPKDIHVDLFLPDHFTNDQRTFFHDRLRQHGFQIKQPNQNVTPMLSLDFHSSANIFDPACIHPIQYYYTGATLFEDTELGNGLNGTYIRLGKKYITPKPYYSPTWSRYHKKRFIPNPTAIRFEEVQKDFQQLLADILKSMPPPPLDSPFPLPPHNKPINLSTTSLSIHTNTPWKKELYAHAVAYLTEKQLPPAVHGSPSSTTLLIKLHTTTLDSNTCKKPAFITEWLYLYENGFSLNTTPPSYREAIGFDRYYTPTHRTAQPELSLKQAQEKIEKLLQLFLEDFRLPSEQNT